MSDRNRAYTVEALTRATVALELLADAAALFHKHDEQRLATELVVAHEQLQRTLVHAYQTLLHSTEPQA